MTMATKRTIFWDVTPFSPVHFHARFGRICYLHLQDLRGSQNR
jgi:hypothetical protein